MLSIQLVHPMYYQFVQESYLWSKLNVLVVIPRKTLEFDPKGIDVTQLDFNRLSYTRLQVGFPFLFHARAVSSNLRPWRMNRF